MKDAEVSNGRGSGLVARWLVTSILLLALSTAFAQPYVYERSFGTYGTEAGQFQQISALDQDSQGNYVILDSYAGEFQVCTGSGVCTQHDTAAKIAQQHGSQWGLAVTSQDEVFITNTNGNVEKCSLAGNCEIFLDEYDGTAISPAGIAIDANDRIYIADLSYARILVCNPAGSCSSFGSWGTEIGQFYYPYAIAVNAAGQVVIADSGNYSVQVCDYMGHCELTGYENANFYYGGYGQGFTLLPSGTMLATGYGYGYPHVNACTPIGACRVVGHYDGSNPGYLQSPSGILVNQEGRLVVGDYGAVHFLRPNPTINPGINDAWIEQGIPGQGLLLSVFERSSTVFMAWFTYDATRPSGFEAAEIGEWGHRWVTLQGGYSGKVAHLGIYLTEGGVFESANPPPDDAVEIGEATLTLNSCYSATLDYVIHGTNYQGTKNLVRITGDNVSNCQVLSGAD